MTTVIYAFTILLLSFIVARLGLYVRGYTSRWTHKLNPTDRIVYRSLYYFLFIVAIVLFFLGFVMLIVESLYR